MKFPIPLAFAVLLAACSTPQTRVVDHQARLNDEARENFYRTQKEHRERLGIVVPPPKPAQPVAQNAPQPEAKLRPFRGLRPPTPPPTAKTKPAPTPKPLAKAKPTPAPKLAVKSAPKPAPKPAPAPAKNRRVYQDDTIYEPTAAGRQEQRTWELRQADHYKAYEAREARRLGKRPDQLTREERLWIRESFQ